MLILRNPSIVRLKLKTMDMTVKIDIGDQLREDLLVTALEGGSNYWYYLSVEAYDLINKSIRTKQILEPPSIKMWDAIKHGASIPIYDEENKNEKLGEINLESIAKGEQMMVDKYFFHFKKLLDKENVEWDAETADVWFQLAVMGEITFG